MREFDGMQEVDTGIEGPEEIPSKLPGADCAKCKLLAHPCVPSFIPDNVDVIVIGEAPGSEEVNAKEPFVGQSGQLLRMVVEQNGYDPTRMLKTNIVACRPPKNRTPKPGEIKACRGRLQLELASYANATILAMGKVANKWFNKDFELGDRGLWTTYETTGAKVMATWHPAYVLRKPSMAYQFIPDVDKAFRGYEEMSRFLAPPDKIVVKDITHLREVLSRCPENAYVAYDLETDNVVWYVAFVGRCK